MTLPLSEVPNKENLRKRLSDHLRCLMTRLLDSGQNSDVVLVSSDQHKFAVHQCVLKTRASGFYNTYIVPALSQRKAVGSPVSVFIADADAKTLQFFLRCVYTAEDVPAGFIGAHSFSDDSNFPGPSESNEDQDSLRDFSADSKPDTNQSSSGGVTANLKNVVVPSSKSGSVNSSAAEKVVRSQPQLSESFVIPSTDDSPDAQNDPQLEALMQQIDRTLEDRSESIRQAQFAKVIMEQDTMSQYYADNAAVSVPGEFLRDSYCQYQPAGRELLKSSSRRSMTSFAELGQSVSSLNSLRDDQLETASVFFAPSDVSASSWMPGEGDFHFNSCAIPGGTASLPGHSALYEVQRQEAACQLLSSGASLAESAADNSLMSTQSNATYGRPASLSLLRHFQQPPSAVYYSEAALGSPMQHSYHGDIGVLSERIDIRERRCSVADITNLRHASSLQLLDEGTNHLTETEDGLDGNKEHGKIFPLFIELDRTSMRRSETMSKESLQLQQQDKESYESTDVRFSARRKRWSVISHDRLSIGSQENMSCPADGFGATDTAEPMEKCFRRDSFVNPEDASQNFRFGNFEACSKLGYDLLLMLTDEIETDICISVNNSAHTIRAHRGLLACVSQQTKETLEQNPSSINLNEYKEDTVRCALSIIYGGSVTLLPGVDLFELMDLAETLGLSCVREVVEYHLWTALFHKFHRPCSTCANSVKYLCLILRCDFEALLSAALKWITRYFTYLWPRKAFCTLSDDIQTLCYGNLIKSLTPSRVIDVVLGCDQIRNHVSRAKWSAPVLTMVSSLYDMAIEYAALNLDAVIASQRFLQLGKTLGTEISVVDDVLSAATHSIPADMACKVHHRLDALSRILTQDNSSMQMFTERFLQLVKRLKDLCESHMLHNASATVKSEGWNTLSPEMQERILQGGIFVEFNEPTAARPTLSSRNRKFKRSSSSGPVGAHSIPTQSVSAANSPRRSISSTRSEKPLPANVVRTKSSGNVVSDSPKRRKSQFAAAPETSQLMALPISEDMETCSPQELSVTPTNFVEGDQQPGNTRCDESVSAEMAKGKPLEQAGLPASLAAPDQPEASLTQSTICPPLVSKVAEDQTTAEDKLSHAEGVREAEVISEGSLVPQAATVLVTEVKRNTKPTAEVKPIGKSTPDAGSVNARSRPVASRTVTSSREVPAMTSRQHPSAAAHSGAVRTLSGQSAVPKTTSLQASSQGSRITSKTGRGTVSSAAERMPSLPVSSVNDSETQGNRVSANGGSQTFRINSSTLTRRKAPK